MSFCSPFDEALAHGEVPCVFRRDHEGLWRLEVNWARNAWTQDPGPHAPGWRYALFHDHGTGHVQLLLVTGPTLLATHQRGTVYLYEAEADAQAVLDALGKPYLAAGDWTP